MLRSVENLSEGIISVTYPASSIGSGGLIDGVPIDFTWNGKRVIRQSEVSFVPVPMQVDIRNSVNTDFFMTLFTIFLIFFLWKGHTETFLLSPCHLAEF